MFVPGNLGETLNEQVKPCCLFHQRSDPSHKSPPHTPVFIPTLAFQLALPFRDAKSLLPQGRQPEGAAQPGWLAYILFIFIFIFSTLY